MSALPDTVSVLVGDVRDTSPTIPTGSVQMVCTSPPYFGLRLYGDAGEEIGKERDLDAYVASLVAVMRECRRVLRDDGTAWVNLGDSYATATKVSPPHRGERASRNQDMHGFAREREFDVAGCNVLLVPFRVAAALQADGWTLRAMLPWVKLASMPESVQSRPCIAHEYVLFLTKRPSGYFYDADAVRVAALQPDGVAKKTGKHTKTTAGGVQRNGTYNSILGSNQGAPFRSYRSSDVWRAGAREAGAALLAAADGEAVGMLTNDDAPAAFCVNPKGSGIPHFAMWPTRLVAPMVLASTPEAGCCSACGAPWMRVTEVGGDSSRDRLKRAGRHMQKDALMPGRADNMGARHGLNHAGGHGNGLRPRSTLGFRPSCDHDAPAVPAVVLDPFSGAFTTAGVAVALGRRAIGCELYQSNADLAPMRMAIVRDEVAEYLRERQQGEKAAAIEAAAKGQIELFGVST